MSFSGTYAGATFGGPKREAEDLLKRWLRSGETRHKSILGFVPSSFTLEKQPMKSKRTTRK